MTRIKIKSARLPALETVFALDLLVRGRGGELFTGWRAPVRARLGDQVRRLKALNQAVATQSQLFALEGDERPEATLPPEVATAYHEFTQAAITPYWPRIRDHLDGDRDTRAGHIATGGVERLLSTLHPQVSWESPVLSTPFPTPQDIQLAGRGLVLVPSLFLVDRVTVLPSRATGEIVLAYPARLDPDSAAAIWNVANHNERALDALVGRTRAAVLNALTDTPNTGELGRRLGISSAAVSQHTSVLRKAGLITTRRHLNTAIHSLTPLGKILLKGHHESMTRS
ncbi:winged helix-turn-helix domain-containing protein [Actinokineospora sp. NBRC 105648]|uniref:ArsR/SmtB family transcription factor n=1 Tax=Actinokineospora sp. NBRC 105648 TaxID=3032206 RepID=UPI002554B4AD|nr:winged helix-turn-helix domain-containing protein [Actinokineospora sp. NBRC 105648]